MDGFPKMKFKQRKKYQRFLNKQIKDLNKSVEVDELWKGRFFIHQIQSDWIEFDDHSGGILKTCLEFRDKKTKLTWREYFNIFDIHCHYHYFYEIFKKFNDFVNYATQNEKLWEDKTDWRNIPWRA